MLSNHLQNGIETAKMVWSRLPNAEDGDDVADAIGIGKKSDDSGVESLDYEVIENYAYLEEQVSFLRFLGFVLSSIVLGIVFDWFMGFVGG